MAGFNIQKFSDTMNQKGSIQDNKFLVEIQLPRLFTSEPELTRLLSYRASSSFNDHTASDEIRWQVDAGTTGNG